RKPQPFQKIKHGKLLRRGGGVVRDGSLGPAPRARPTLTSRRPARCGHNSSPHPQPPRPTARDGKGLASAGRTCYGSVWLLSATGTRDDCPGRPGGGRVHMRKTLLALLFVLALLCFVRGGEGDNHAADAVFAVGKEIGKSL